MNLEPPLHVDDKDGVIYKYYEKKLNFIDAEAACQAINSRLAHIEAEEAKKRIFKYLQTRDRSYWWIGLRKEEACCWKWLNGPALDKSVIDFVEEFGTRSCGSLFQPAKSSRNTYMYDYSCRTRKMSYICESEAVSYSDPQPPSAFGTAAVIGIALGMVALLATVVILVLLKSRRSRNIRENKNCPKEGSSKTSSVRHSSTEREQNSYYATIDDNAAYATIDTVVYSEVVDESHPYEAEPRPATRSLSSDNTDCPASFSTSEKVYATVCKGKEKRSSALDSPPEYAQVMKKKKKQKQ